MSIYASLEGIREENEDLRYLAETLFRYAVRDEATLEAFVEFSGGSRARSMLRALKTLCPDRRSRRLDVWAGRAIERLESVRFAQGIEHQQRVAAKEAKGIHVIRA